MRIIKIGYTALILFLLSLIAYNHYSDYQKKVNHYQPYFSEYTYFTKYNKDYQKLNFIEQINVKPVILKQISQLRQQGWKKQVINQHYLTSLELSHLNNRLSTNLINQQFQESQKIGNPKFLKLWQYQTARKNQKQAKESLKFLLSYIHFPKMLSLNKRQITSMLNHFDDDLRPTDPFWEDFSQIVTTAFPEHELSQSTDLARKTHQLRYLFSLQQATWIRKHFKLKRDNDANALARYLNTLEENQYTLLESARYHNKIAKGYDKEEHIIPIYPDHIEVTNFKILISFHSEFILTSSGQFLIATDIKETKINAIVNSASFNYANQNDINHDYLDIEPIDYNDPIFITDAINNHGLPFTTPSLKQQKSKTNKQFSRNGISLKTLTEETRQAFIEMMKRLV